MADGWYYLHTNGDLIWKRLKPEQEPGGFVRRVWPVDTTDRATAWTILLEALAAGASFARVKELAAKWGCDSRDLVDYLRRHKATPERRVGVRRFLEQVVGVDPDEWFNWLASTPTGGEPDFNRMPVTASAEED